MKFWGGNLSVNAAMPEKDKSAGVAGRLRKSGINMVRIQDIDRAGLIFTVGQSTRQFNQTQLDKMEYLINELKNNGIYVDLNLLCSREFNSLDGVDDPDSLYLHIATIFDPQLITLQKEYCYNLLKHKNPYTGLTLAEDPVLASAEITNENSLFSFWISDLLKPYSMGGKLSQKHNKMLEDLWNDYLIKKYGNTQALNTAWINNTPELVQDGGFENSNILDKWYLYLDNSSCQASLSHDAASPYNGNNSAKVSVLSSSGTNWHIQVIQFNFSLVNGKEYKIEFAAKSSNSETITLQIGKMTNPYTTFWSKDIALTNQWQKYSYTFTADGTLPNDVQISFQLGANSGDFWFDDVSLQLKPQSGLLTGENLEDKTVHRMYQSEIKNYSDNRVRDLFKFFVDLQENYFNEMRSYLKNDLGIKIPVTATNWCQGLPDVKIQGEMDYVDVHQYWDLNFDGNSFFNNSMINNPSTSTFFNMAGQAISGKPFTISEYNHPFPNRYQVEAPFFLAGYGAYLDADALLFFGLSDALSWEDDRIAQIFPFNITSNNILMSFMPTFGYAYRNGLISSANQTLEVNFSDDDVYNSVEDNIGYIMYPKSFDRNLILTHKLRTGSLTSGKSYTASDYPAASANPYLSDNQELSWNSDGLLKISTDKFIGFVGFLNNYKDEQIGKLKILDADKFAGVTWLSLDNQPVENSKTSLLTIGTRQINSNMVWADNRNVTNWGWTPTIIEPSVLKLQLTINADSIRVNQLGLKGQATDNKTVYYPANGNQYTITIDQNSNPSLWFGIETAWDNISRHKLTINSPVAGDEFKINKVCRINWEKLYVDSLKIEYSDNNGKVWKTVCENVDAKLLSYYWTIPEAESDSCLLKITDNSDSTVYAISKCFSINSSMLTNGNFSNGTTGWIFYVNGSYNVIFSVMDGVLNADVQSAGSDYWSVQAVQQNIKYEKGKTYDCSFDAAGVQNRNIIVEFAENGGTHTVYANSSFNITTDVKNYNTSFVMNNNTDSLALFVMDLGGASIGAKLDNVVLREHKINKTMLFSSPQKSNVWNANSKQDIIWDSNDITNLDIYYKTAGANSWSKIAGKISASLKKYTWTVPNISSDSCQIKLVDSDDSTCSIISAYFYINAVEGVSEGKYPAEYSLSQNYPNPFNPSTRIKYALPKDGFVNLKLYDIMGREVAALVSGYKKRGWYEFEFNASRLSSGFYIYKLKVNDYISIKKMILLK